MPSLDRLATGLISKRGRLIVAALLVEITLLGAMGRADDGETDRAARVAVEIAFATNRGGSGDATLFGTEEGPLAYGFCRVEFSPIPMLKGAARHIPIRFPTEFERIIDLVKLDAGAFWHRIEALAQGRKILLYVHGYGMDFDKSCRRAALLQRNLGYEVAVLLFAWPSQDNLAKYTQDETHIRNSVEPVKTVLGRIATTVGEASTHVVGHSIGTRAVTAAVAGLQGGGVLLRELVLIAPDMDRLEFERRLPALRRVAGGITLYASANDGPLRVSREVHGEPRIGEAGEHLVFFNGVETVDISAVPRRDIYGHNYHYFNDRIIRDLQTLLISGLRASARPGLRPRELARGTYWEMAESM